MIKVELNPGKTCEFAHAEETLADFSVNVGKRFAEYYNACAEHAGLKCGVCSDKVTNDDYVVSTAKEVLCLVCFLYQAEIAIAD